jgi:hypothetical protein
MPTLQPAPCGNAASRYAFAFLLLAPILAAFAFPIWDIKISEWQVWAATPLAMCGACFLWGRELPDLPWRKRKDD